MKCGYAARKMNIARTHILSNLPGYSQPMPGTTEILQGMRHKNDGTDIPNAKTREDFKRQLWPVTRAIGSNKVHYLTNLKVNLDWEKGRDWPYKFEDAFPDTSPASGGMGPLPRQGQQNDWTPYGQRQGPG